VLQWLEQSPVGLVCFNATSHPINIIFGEGANHANQQHHNTCTLSWLLIAHILGMNLGIDPSKSQSTQTWPTTMI
jgi:hypothetical protein